MRTCIYCLKPFEPHEAKPEHILLAALGSGFKSKGIVCNRCNQELGSTIDKSLGEALVFVRNVLELPGSRGTVPAVKAAKGAKTGRQIKLEPGAKPLLKEPNVEIVEVEPGRKRIKISGNPEFVKRVWKELKEKFPSGKLTSKSIQHSYSREPVIIETSGLGGHEHFRAVAKMAFNFLATQDHELVFAKSFDKIRNYIRYGTIEEEQFLCTLDYRDLYVSALPKEETPFYNRVAVFLSAQEHTAVASIELFKHLRFLALLTDSYKEAKSICYVVTNAPLERTHWCSVVTDFPHIGAKEILNWPSYEEVAKYHYYKSLPALLSDLMDFHYKRFPKRVIEEAIDKYLKKPGKTTITPEDIDKISEYIARQVVFGTMPVDQEVHLEDDLEDL
jgi:hypothetical protein